MDAEQIESVLNQCVEVIYGRKGFQLQILFQEKSRDDNGSEDWGYFLTDSDDCEEDTDLEEEMVVESPNFLTSFEKFGL